MTDEDALALILVSLEVLSYRHLYAGESTSGLPVGLIRQALELIEERLGREETATIRSHFAAYGLDFSDVSSGASMDLRAEDVTSLNLADTNGTESLGRTSRNRIRGPIEEAIRANHQAGWSKSRIAREFRLNRRTVIRICSGR